MTSGAYDSRPHHAREPRHSAGGGHQTKIANALKRYINEIETTAMSAGGYVAPQPINGSSTKHAQSRDSHRGGRSASNKKQRKSAAVLGPSGTSGNLMPGSQRVSS